MANRISHVSPEQTLLLAECSLQAYNPTDQVTPPSGYKLIGSWTGEDASSIFGDNNPNYGLIFQNESQTDEYIFAFRGTADWEELFIDAFFNEATFHPHANDVSANQATIATGFWDIYSEATGNGGPSMQDQLFTWMEQLKPATLYITGHSLGSALAELFNLDLALSLPASSLPSTINHYNFACPRVGKSTFSGLYAEKVPNEVIRFVNYWDFVPFLPPSTLLKYKHATDYFLLAFYEKGAWVVHPTVRHSMFNYQQVLTKAVAAPNQIYIGDVTGLDNVTLKSVQPPQSELSTEELDAFRQKAHPALYPNPSIGEVEDHEDGKDKKGCSLMSAALLLVVVLFVWLLAFVN